MCSLGGTSEEKILAVEEHTASEYFSPAEKVALALADAMTLSHEDVSEALFARVREHYGEEQIIELCAAIAWENASSKFNRALRIGSQGLWKRASTTA